MAGSAETVTEQPRPPIRLHVSDAFSLGVDLGARQGEYFKVSGDALSGTSGILRALSGERSELVSQMSKDGIKFLNRVVQDIEDLRDGVDIWSRLGKINYHPGEVLGEYARINLAGSEVVVIDQKGSASELMTIEAYKLLPILDTLAQGKRISRAVLTDAYNRLLSLSAPHFNLAESAHEDWMHGTLSPAARAVYFDK